MTNEEKILILRSRERLLDTRNSLENAGILRKIRRKIRALESNKSEKSAE